MFKFLHRLCHCRISKYLYSFFCRNLCKHYIHIWLYVWIHFLIGLLWLLDDLSVINLLVFIPIRIHFQSVNAGSCVFSCWYSTIFFTLCVIWILFVCICYVLIFSICYFLYILNQLIYFIRFIYSLHITMYTVFVCFIFLGCASFIIFIDFMFLVIIFFNP